MHYFIVAGILVTAIVFTAGCFQAPQISEVKSTINETLPEIYNSTENSIPVVIHPTFISVVRAHTVSPPTQRTLSPIKSTEPLVGKWTLVGNVNYQCDTVFRDDKSGSVRCSAGFIPVLNEDVTWKPVDSTNGMREYEVLRNDGTIYTASYSYRTGDLISETFPENSHMIKVNR